MPGLYKVHEPATGRQANNLPLEILPEVVRPWFKDAHSKRVNTAIDQLADARHRKEALNFLGLELDKVA